MPANNLSRREFIRLAGAGAAAMMILGCGNETEATQPPYKPLDGLSYSPFRPNQSPILGKYPSETEVRNDLQMLKNIAPKIRTYGTENILYRIPEFCRDAGIDCYPGAWIDDVQWDDQQVADLVSIGNLGYSTTKKLVVGNEFVYRRPSSKPKLLNYISQVRQATGMQVGAAEQWHIWRDHADLAHAVDFMFVHVHPYWENQSIENAANFVLDKCNFIKQLYPGKQIFIAETGWPSAGETHGQSVPSEANQARFLSEFFDIAQENGIEYFLFSAFDEKWKTDATGIEAEAYWGIFDENRQRKSGLTSLLEKDFRVKGLSNAGELDVKTFESNQ
jgi:exo-beta-1,3-glucanase (GH17 family)